MLLNFTGLVMLYALRVNLSVAIVSMVKTNSTSSLADFPLLKSPNKSSIGILENQTSSTTTIGPDLAAGEFDWDEKTQG